MPLGGLLGRLWREYVSRYLGDIAAAHPGTRRSSLRAGVSYALILKYTTDGMTEGDVRPSCSGRRSRCSASTGVARGGALGASRAQSQSIALKVLRDLQAIDVRQVDGCRFRAATPAKNRGGWSRASPMTSTSSAKLSCAAANRSFAIALTLIGAIASMLYFDWVLTLIVFAAFALAGGPLQMIWPNAPCAKPTCRTGANGRAFGALNGKYSAFPAPSKLMAWKTARKNARQRRVRGAAQEWRRSSRIAARALCRCWRLSGGHCIGRQCSGSQAGAFSMTSMTVGDLIGMIGAVGVAAPAARTLGQLNTLVGGMPQPPSQRIFGLDR